jgi:hypothetical protein
MPRMGNWSLGLRAAAHFRDDSLVVLQGPHAIICHVILVTGATGFIGRALLRQLMDSGREVRVMIRPSRRSPRLPKGLGRCPA